MTQHGLGRQEALNACGELRDRITHRFLDLRTKVLPDASPMLSRYLDRLACLLRGNYEWGVRAADRYTNPDGHHPGAVRTLDTIGDTPAVTGAPGIPAIDWWWTL
ncbi:hypothetical protein [Kitasatospora purpeofusca]|uniref:Uncharacterized protein n=1 Tax=Kitasatospora purpeofusca TaxID=67352 RepID=A0ABZ1UBH5_9ACTN|nr:hypothetical protein [Kitasatospora purpeofusca]